MSFPLKYPLELLLEGIKYQINHYASMNIGKNEKRPTLKKVTVQQLLIITGNISVSMQLDAQASNLNSNDAFILVTPGDSFLWVGVGASDTEKQGAQQLCDILGVSVSELSEGGESGEETG